MDWLAHIMQESIRAFMSCQCQACREPGFHSDKQLHRRMNLLLSRMDEQQRRWYVASESMRIGYGGDVLVQKITRHAHHSTRHDPPAEAERNWRTIRRTALADRVRLKGGGRPPVEKKIPPSSRS